MKTSYILSGEWAINKPIKGKKRFVLLITLQSAGIDVNTLSFIEEERYPYICGLRWREYGENRYRCYVVSVGYIKNFEGKIGYKKLMRKLKKIINNRK